MISGSSFSAGRSNSGASTCTSRGSALKGNAAAVTNNADSAALVQSIAAVGGGRQPWVSCCHLQPTAS
jgi:hypothetical protein